MLIPRFSIRWILLFTSFCAVVSFVIARAFQGEVWAMALTSVIGLFTATFVMYGASFLAAYALARSTKSLDPVIPPTNPFAQQGEFPPQIVPQNHAPTE